LNTNQNFSLMTLVPYRRFVTQKVEKLQPIYRWFSKTRNHRRAIQKTSEKQKSNKNQKNTKYRKINYNWGPAFTHILPGAASHPCLPSITSLSLT